MNSKNNRVNHNFQILHFLVGSCYTADGAFSLLCDLREERENALNTVEVAALREKAKRITIERLLKSEDEVTRLNAEADLLEIDLGIALSTRNIAAAKDELAYINECIEKITPLRKFAHLPDHESHEACQQEEWKLEFKSRIENQLLTTGTITPDDFNHMRMHPEFLTFLLPTIDHVSSRLAEPEGRNKFLEDSSKKELDFPKLLGHV